MPSEGTSTLAIPCTLRQVNLLMITVISQCNYPRTSAYGVCCTIVMECFCSISHGLHCLFSRYCVNHVALSISFHFQAITLPIEGTQFLLLPSKNPTTCLLSYPKPTNFNLLLVSNFSSSVGACHRLPIPASDIKRKFESHTQSEGLVAPCSKTF